MGQEASGRLDVNVEYNYLKREGSFNLSSGALSFKTPLMNVQADSLTGEGRVETLMLTIDSLKTEGAAQLSLKGNIQLNTNNIMRSGLNLTGEGALMGMNSRFSIIGPLNTARFNLL
jgi:hypothetical protein